jgi:hypothetical protein
LDLEHLLHRKFYSPCFQAGRHSGLDEPRAAQLISAGLPAWANRVGGAASSVPGETRNTLVFDSVLPLHLSDVQISSVFVCSALAASVAKERRIRQFPRRLYSLGVLSGLSASPSRVASPPLRVNAESD